MQDKLGSQAGSLEEERLAGMQAGRDCVSGRLAVMHSQQGVCALEASEHIVQGPQAGTTSHARL
jgi:hypothetical protein